MGSEHPRNRVVGSQRRVAGLSQWGVVTWERGAILFNSLHDQCELRCRSWRCLRQIKPDTTGHAAGLEHRGIRGKRRRTADPTRWGGAWRRGDARNPGGHPRRRGVRPTLGRRWLHGGDARVVGYAGGTPDEPVRGHGVGAGVHRPRVQHARQRTGQPDHPLAAGAVPIIARRLRGAWGGRCGDVPHRKFRADPRPRAVHVGPRLVATIAATPAGPTPQGRAARLAAHGGVPASSSQRRGADRLGAALHPRRLCPPQRFETLRELLGERFEAIEIDSSPNNPHGLGRRAHSVLTAEFVDRQGHPTHAAMARTLAFLAERLQSDV